jgi:hypothetical protein
MADWPRVWATTRVTMCVCWPTHMKEKSPKLQSPWEGPYRVVMRINDVVYRIQLDPRSRMMLVNLDRPSCYQGTTQNKLL